MLLRRCLPQPEPAAIQVAFDRRAPPPLASLENLHTFRWRSCKLEGCRDEIMHGCLFTFFSS
ncbi:hypothetical protein PVAP13_4NG046197 [Panicum virgatum]|uniref:Uncharacterized protein n=1 Tax=Panicum virgatum TaxID=38727 RepID=A0A8T0TEX6_PANVG|nr:hypothetical protein PVAP13_4NG046197 [Panicum virgatum]